jgi:hypothetical protein
METYKVTVAEIKLVVCTRGYYAIYTPVQEYDAKFILFLVRSWKQVYKMIFSARDGRIKKHIPSRM